MLYFFSYTRVFLYFPNCKGFTYSIGHRDYQRETKRKRIKYLESHQIPLFLQTAHQYGYNYWLFFRLLIETGMRKGEAAALQWTDIDLKEQTISIQKL